MGASWIAAAPTSPRIIAPNLRPSCIVNWRVLTLIQAESPSIGRAGAACRCAALIATDNFGRRECIGAEHACCAYPAPIWLELKI